MKKSEYIAGGGINSQNMPRRKFNLFKFQPEVVRTEGRVFVTIDGDNIGASVARAAAKDDLFAIMEQSHLISVMQKLIGEWAKAKEADIYISGGDDKAFTLRPEYIPELDSLREMVLVRTGYSITVGVGDSISRSGQAMMYGKLNGKNQVNEWTPEIAQKLAQISKQLSPEEKMAEHGLLKARLAKQMETPLKKSMSLAGMLQKGAMRRLAPNPQKMNEKDAELTRQWVNAGIDNREIIPRTEGDARKRMLHRLSSMTAARVGADNKREFLLHRGMSSNEANNNIKDGMSHYHKGHKANSWSTSHSEATAFGGGVDNVRSLWVHEDDIHMVPKFNNNVPMSTRLKNENEVIVHHTRPHKEVSGDEAFKMALPYSKYKDDTTLPVMAEDGYIDHKDQSDVNYRINRGLKRIQKSLLEKGLRGDWQKEGYRLEHEKDTPNSHMITAYDKNGNEAGYVSMLHAQDNTLLPSIAVVHKEHKRKGLATAMYKLAEEKSGRKVGNYPKLQSEQAKKFWAQPNKPFGKSEAQKPTKYVASVAVIDPVRHMILMGRRSDNGKWTLPGGGCDPGEHPVESAKRELWEEAGVKLDLEYLESKVVTGYNGGQVCVHAFMAYGSPNTTSKNDPDKEVVCWEWVPLTEGLPKDVKENLHSPKNVVLMALELI